MVSELTLQLYMSGYTEYLKMQPFMLPWARIPDGVALPPEERSRYTTPPIGPTKATMEWPSGNTETARW